MNKLICQKLSEVEKEHHIKILIACESGSRAWGFPSPNSDYDVRFIYIYPKVNYLAITEPEPQLTFPIDDHDIDLVGWDLKKCLQLVRRSNSTVFEWLQSPIIYQEEKGFKEKLLSICPNYFNQKTNIHHYLGIANTASKSLQDQQISIKKLFYILRPILSAKWCMENSTIAPMNIQELMPLLPTELQHIVQNLIAEKQNLSEKHPIEINHALLGFIESTIENCRTFANSLQQNYSDENELNMFFLSELKHEY